MSNRNRKYTNGTITVVWQPDVCVHSAICFTSMRSVFNPVRRPWIDLSQGETENILAIVEKCPSMALTFFWNDEQKNKTEKSPKLFDTKQLDTYFPNGQGKKGEEEGEKSIQNNNKGVRDSAVQITFRPGMPLMVRGEDIQIIDGAGNVIGDSATGLKVASFCRCGLSGKQPFCDGAHAKTGFDK